MRKSSSRGLKLTTVIFAVLIMTVSAILSNTSIADDMEVKTAQSESQWKFKPCAQFIIELQGFFLCYRENIRDVGFQYLINDVYHSYF